MIVTTWTRTATTLIFALLSLLPALAYGAEQQVATIAPRTVTPLMQAQERPAGARTDGTVSRRITVSTLVPQQVERTVRRVADNALRSWNCPWRHWTMGPLYEGLLNAGLATGDPKYLAAVVRRRQHDSVAARPQPLPRRRHGLRAIPGCAST